MHRIAAPAVLVEHHRHASCGPVSAASAAFCVMDVDVRGRVALERVARAMTAAGPMAQPQRQPVIA
jgi:hypothetical protein